MIYEATFTHDGVLVRTNLFFREAGRCRFTEVKAGTSLEKHHVQDAAIQAWVLRGSGVPVHQIRLAHVDSGFVFHDRPQAKVAGRHAPLLQRPPHPAIVILSRGAAAGIRWRHEESAHAIVATRAA